MTGRRTSLLAVVLGVVLALGSGVGSASGSAFPVPGHAQADHGPLNHRHTGALAATAVLQRPHVRSTRPLAGRAIVVDPGHQLGNHNFPREINRLVPAGGFRKPCNTTGTATRGGYSEATFVWRVSLRLRDRLQRLGAEVVMTRSSNRQDRWGPCVDARGRAGNRLGADLKVSVHADGSYVAGARGFHVIAPADRAPWTHDIARSSRRLGLAMRRGLAADGFLVANYIAGGDGLDVRSDLGTLNLSDVPTVMVELGNMRNPAEARRMTARRGQASYAKALVAGVRRFLR